MTAQAQQDGFALNRYRPAPTTEDGFALQLPRTLGPLRPSFQLTLDYSKAPLVLGEIDGGADVGSIVDDSLAAHLYGALGIADRYEVFVGLPVILFQAGNQPAGAFAEPSVAGVGMPEVGGSVRLLGEDEQGFQLGLAASLLIPVGQDEAFASDESVGVRGRLMAAYSGVFTPVANVGVAYRKASDFQNVDIGTELTFGLGLHWALMKPLTLMTELHGATGMRSGQAFSRLGTPLEWLLGARYTTAMGLSAGGAFSLGLSEAPGSPDARVLLSVGYAPPRPEPPAAAPKAKPKKKPGDRDGDGILDDVDECPDDPEDKDGFEDEDGCPDPDNDKDGILDVDDKCPNEPETKNGFDDEDGCPDEAPEVRIESGEVVMPEPIRFKFDSDVILEVSHATLMQVAMLLQQHPEIKLLSIEGHASDEGTPQYNQELSERRASAVVKFLVDRGGIEASRLRSVGYGVSQPLVPNDNEEHRQLNRRVEFVIAEQALPEVSEAPSEGASEAPPSEDTEAGAEAAQTPNDSGAPKEEP